MPAWLLTTGASKVVAAPTRAYYENVHGWQVLLVLACVVVSAILYTKVVKRSPGLGTTLLGGFLIVLVWVFFGAKGLESIRLAIIDTWHWVKAKWL